jgi:hypothetical protein
MKTRMKTLTLGMVLLLGSVGCDGLTTEPDNIDMAALRAEAALVAADGMFQDLSLAQDPGLQEVGFDGMAGGPLLSAGQGGEGGNGGQCQRMGQGPTFDCGQMMRDGFTFTREVTFYDAEGAEQLDGFHKATTDAIHFVVNGEGTRERAYWTVTMERSRDMWLTELLSDAHHLDGEGHSMVYRSGNPADGTERTFDMTVDVVWDDVVHLQPKAEHPYPESGTITREIFVEVTKDGEVVGGRDVTTVITFNGTQFVTMLVNGEEFEIDLAEGGVMRRWMRRNGQG